MSAHCRGAVSIGPLPKTMTQSPPQHNHRNESGNDQNDAVDGQGAPTQATTDYPDQEPHCIRDLRA